MMEITEIGQELEKAGVKEFPGGWVGILYTEKINWGRTN